MLAVFTKNGEDTWPISDQGLTGRISSWGYNPTAGRSALEWFERGKEGGQYEAFWQDRDDFIRAQILAVLQDFLSR